MSDEGIGTIEFPGTEGAGETPFAEAEEADRFESEDDRPSRDMRSKGAKKAAVFDR